MTRNAPLPDLRAGVYRHYKGPLYLVLGYAHDANHIGRRLVVYVGLELTEARPGPRISVRDADDFLATVNPWTGETLSLDDYHAPGNARLRFTYVGPTWEVSEMRRDGPDAAGAAVGDALRLPDVSRGCGGTVCDDASASHAALDAAGARAGRDADVAPPGEVPAVVLPVGSEAVRADVAPTWGELQTLLVNALFALATEQRRLFARLLRGEYR